MKNPLSIDHIVIMVNDLPASQRDYAALGFTVLNGGTHADNPTYNALITLADGAYLEIIALQPGKESEPQSARLQKWVAASPGLVDIALLPTDIEADILAARSRGLTVEDAEQGGRLRPDGVKLIWQTANIPGSGLPFLCGDVTERHLRVPTGAAQQHANGVVGIADVTIAVRNLLNSAKQYEALLGVAPVPTPIDETLQAKVTQFSLGNTTLTLAEPSQADSPLQAYLDRAGERPYRLTFKTKSPEPPRDLPLNQTHQARIRLI